MLFGDIWERKELSRDRSLITVAALIAVNRTDQLPFHLQTALENGAKRQELIEEITHLAFYSGWPAAVPSVTVAKEVFSKWETLSREARGASMPANRRIFIGLIARSVAVLAIFAATATADTQEYGS